jgi:hypothetical protein
MQNVDPVFYKRSGVVHRISVPQFLRSVAGWLCRAAVFAPP